MGCLKLPYHENETALNESWKIFVNGQEKNASGEKNSKDYYTGGSIMPGRSYVAGDYRYGGANGQERVDEIKGYGNHYTAKFWEYDPRLMRRWNLDPKPTIGVSDYSVYLNNPISNTDVLGDKPNKWQAARMAAHVYGDKSDKILKGGWKVSKRDFGPTVGLNNKENGLHSQVYERTRKGKTEYVYATAGTEDATDVREDALQPLGTSKQYDQSVFNAKEISKQLGKGTELTFTGHSLGGGEAAANAYATGRDAITFNAAGVGAISLAKYGFSFISKIDAYILVTDPLNGVQNTNPVMPDVNGKRHYLKPRNWAGVYNGHSMENVLKALYIDGSKYKKNKGASGSW
jgi:hypothetical protein